MIFIINSLNFGTFLNFLEFLWRNVKNITMLTRGGASSAPHDVMLEAKPEEFTSADLDAPFDTALRAFVKVERKMSAKFC